MVVGAITRGMRYERAIVMFGSLVVGVQMRVGEDESRIEPRYFGLAWWFMIFCTVYTSFSHDSHA